MADQTLPGFLEALYADLNAFLSTLGQSSVESILEANATVRAKLSAMPTIIAKLPAGALRTDLAVLEGLATEQYRDFQPHLDAAIADGEWSNEIDAINAARTLQAVLRVGISEFAGEHGISLDPVGGRIATAAELEAREVET